jgi:flagellar FliJ protein
MKRFEFRLQRLLQIRETKEKEIQNELARLVSIQNMERMKQEQYRRGIAEQQAKFTGKIKAGRYSYSEAVMFERYVDFAQNVIRDQQKRIEAMEPEIRKVRERLVEASRERKVVERLKERRWNEYLYDVNREISKENDDANSQIFYRKKLEEFTGRTHA